MRRNDLYDLDPRFRTAFVKLAEHPLVLEHHFRPFEAYRGDNEQLRVFNLGTSKARPGESPHQYGLAVDFVPYEEPLGWVWHKASCPCWEALCKAAISVGLDTHFYGQHDDGDLPHVQVANWKAIRSEQWRHTLRKRHE